MNNQNQSISDALKQIEQGIQNISHNEEWLKYLSFSAKFHNYSLNNCLLLFLQMPEATFVAGFNKWNQLGRHVKKGEKALKIFAPCRYKIDDSDNDESDQLYVVKGFKLVSVFDISQTAGNDSKLPVLITGLQKHVINEQSIYENLLDAIPMPITETPTLSAKGCYYIDEQRIEIKDSISVVQKIKTLIHEYGHHLHHTSYFSNESKELSEAIAESTAFVVSSYLGIDVSDYSIPYLKSWCSDINTLKTVFTKVKQISSDIICVIEKSSGSTEINVAV